MFQLAGQIFLGLVIGTLAKLFLPGKDLGGVLVMALVGLAGSALGTVFSYLLFEGQATLGWLFSIAGAAFVLLLYGVVQGYRSHYGQSFFHHH